MSRATKTIKLPESKYEVEIPTYLTWGEREDIQSVILDGVNLKGASVDGFDVKKMKESQNKAFEIAIKKITLDGKAVPFSKEWLRELPASDGDFLYSEIDGIDKKKESVTV